MPPKENMTIITDHKEKSPRVGDEYQTEIPSLISQSKYISEIKNKFSGKVVDSELPSDSFSSKLENESLLLGLCIFGKKGKDFTEIRKFLGCETTGNIISFYYGNKFYKSDEYRIWSNYKRAKSRNVVVGKWIFKGFRLKILLSRLCENMSAEDVKSISKASTLFKDQKMTLVEFVSTLKNITGMKSLVEAMAIGKRKKDITRMTREPRKKRLDDFPDGITCFSSLTPAQILDFLIELDIHKRKGVSNGLFWEAVWPLLLARGWHSEQSRPCYTKTESLVFLVPGVAKFSRRSGLVRGMHYFDSIFDVLIKVSSDPSLLSMEEVNTDSENRMISDFVHGEPKEVESARKRQKIFEEQRPLFDLNYPPSVPVDFDPCGTFLTNEEGDLDSNEPIKKSLEEQQTTVAAIENGGGQRKSSRNSHPTTRVMEAIADGSLKSAGRPRTKSTKTFT